MFIREASRGINKLYTDETRSVVENIYFPEESERRSKFILLTIERRREFIFLTRCSKPFD